MIFPLFDKSKDVLPKRVKYLISDFWYILLIHFFYWYEKILNKNMFIWYVELENIKIIIQTS